MTDIPEKLPPYERAAALLLFLTILFAIGLNYYLDEGEMPKPSSEPHYLVSPYIEVTVKGAVKQPGVYQVERGTLVKDVISMAQPHETASLKNIKLEAKITRRRTLNIKQEKRK